MSGGEIYDVFVGNVTTSATEEILRQTFEWIGKNYIYTHQLIFRVIITNITLFQLKVQ